MKKFIAIFALIVLFSMPALANDSPEALQNAFVKAMEANDPGGLAACYADDASMPLPSEE